MESGALPLRGPVSGRAYPFLSTQYLVVDPPPRYEIVGLLQQRSYTAVNHDLPLVGNSPAPNSLFRCRSRRIAQ